MTEYRTYQVGGHIFILDFPKGILSEKEIEPYAPFQTDSCCVDNKLFSLSLIENTDDLASNSLMKVSLEDENGKMIVFTEEDGNLTFYLSTMVGSECGRICISKNYCVAKAWIGGTPGERRYALDTALMLLYTFASSKHDTILLHASAVEYQEEGYLFLGKSGTGKSTHSRLWTEHIKGTRLLNDDNPIVRIVDGKVYVYGSPWSGKTCCYRNCRLPARGIVRLHQAPFNKITPLFGVVAYAALLPSCSCMKWDSGMAKDIHSTICQVIEKVCVYQLDCLPNRESAELCFTTLTI